MTVVLPSAVAAQAWLGKCRYEGVTLLAHRGVTAKARDNSTDALSAVAHAARLGIPLGIEMDIRAAADALVLNHDPFEWGLPLFDVPLSQLRAELKADAPITFTRGLELLQDVPLINVEVKENGTGREAIELVIRHCETTGAPFESFMFVSFIPRAVAEIKQLDPRFKTGILIEGNLSSSRPTPDRVCLTLDDDPDQVGVDVAETMWKVADHVHADFLSPHWTRLNRRVFELAAANGKHLVPWSVNNRHLLDALARPEVAHIVTDFPELIYPELGQTLSHRKLGPLADSE